MKKFKFLGALFVWLIWLVSFWYCENMNLTFLEHWNLTISSAQDYTYTLTNTIPEATWYCIRYVVQRNYNWWTPYISSQFSFQLYPNTASSYYKWYSSVRYWYVNGSTATVPSAARGVLCNMTPSQVWDVTSFHFNFDWQSNWNWLLLDFDIYTFNWISPFSEWWSCTNYTSEECQQEYSLMPITSCNSEYCWLNWLCSEYTWSTMSELYINWINHLGAPIINISIPLEQAWDYEYTWDVMNINLSWENNVDYEYIDNIIRTQNSKPNDTDFNNIVSGLLPLFVPWLIIITFLIYLFRFIKKIF